MSVMREPFDWWDSLRHGGMLVSLSRIKEAYPEQIEPLRTTRSEQLRRAISRYDSGEDSGGARLLDAVLIDLCGLEHAGWRSADLGSEWSRRLAAGESVRPRRVWHAESSVPLPVFVEKEARLGVGRGRRSVVRVIEWMRATDCRLALLTNLAQWRLIYAGLDFDCWVEWDTDLWFEGGEASAQIDALRILLSQDSLAPIGKDQPSKLLKAILDSRRGEAELSAILGERVRQAVEMLIQAYAEPLADLECGTSNADIYRAATRMVMRIVVVLFAEARGLLPLDNDVYFSSYSLQSLIQELGRYSGASADRLRERSSAWPRMLALFRLIFEGSDHERMPILRYGGGLFRQGDPVSDNGITRAIAVFENTETAPSDSLIAAILQKVSRTAVKIKAGVKSTIVEAPVDFSDLGSEYIGILYEGLLDFELRPADGPVVFLALGDEPALPLGRLEAMDDPALKNLVAKLKVKAKKATGEAEEGGEEDEDAEEEDGEEDDEETTDEPGTERTALAGDATSYDDAHRAAVESAQRWAAKAVRAGGLVAKPRSKTPAALVQYNAQVDVAATALIRRVVVPGEWYLVRWGGTRKGAGTFYTPPQLAGPTAIRTLLPLACDPPAPGGKPDPLARPGAWQPKTPDQILALKVCDPAMGSASFLVASLRYLTDCLSRSLFDHNWVSQTDIGIEINLDAAKPAWLREVISDLPAGAEDVMRARLKRLVVERCLYGVDIDPLAVELGRLALWVETMDRNLPFEFLDHKLKVGNSLVGCWFDRFRDYPLMAWKREGGDKNHANGTHFEKGATTKAISELASTTVRREMIDAISTQKRLDYEAEFGKEPEAVQADAGAIYEQLAQDRIWDATAREEHYGALLEDSAYQQVKRAFDTWCAVWFWPANHLSEAPLPLSFHRLTPAQEEILTELVREHRFFHWELEFPDVFDTSGQGFDAIVGNPPWETLKPNSKEFFSNIDPLYRAYGKQEAIDWQKAIFQESGADERRWLEYVGHYKALSNYFKQSASPYAELKNEDEDTDLAEKCPFGAGKEKARLHATWQNARATRKGFADPAHPYRIQGGGDINSYKLFVELGYRLLCAGGQIGLILPSGVYTDKGSTLIRRLFLSQSEWQWLFGFENRNGIFNIHRSFKFCPIIVRKGGRTQSIRAAFMRRSLSDWEEGESFAVSYPADRIERFSPWSRSILEIHGARDLQVLEKICSNSVLLGDKGPRGWGMQYATEFHMANDSKLFPPRAKWESDGYVSDIYGRWIKPKRIAQPDERTQDVGWIELRGGNGFVHESEIGSIALPLYQGLMLWQFESDAVEYVTGAGSHARWVERTSRSPSMPGSQYLMSASTAVAFVSRCSLNRIAFRTVQNATNQRTLIASIIPGVPCGHSLWTGGTGHLLADLSLTALMSSFVFDRVLRPKMSQGNVSMYYLDETPVPPKSLTMRGPNALYEYTASLTGYLSALAPLWIRLAAHNSSGMRATCIPLALTPHERLRIRSNLDALCAQLYGLDIADFARILHDCDHPREWITNKANARTLDSKGFWRVDKDKDPELRHTVLSLVSFHHLKAVIEACGGDRDAGIEAFCSQNDGEGWMLPETLKLSDYGLGHDERATRPQPVRERLGERFLPWQLEQTPEESWAECERHARNILGEAGYKQLLAEIEEEKRRRGRPAARGMADRTKESIEVVSSDGNPIGEAVIIDVSPEADEEVEPIAGETDLFGVPVQKDLFGGAVGDQKSKKRRK